MKRELTYEDLRNFSEDVWCKEQEMRDALAAADDPIEFVLTKEFTALVARLAQARIKAALDIRKKEAV